MKKIFVTIVFLLLVSHVDAQCAMCRAVLESDADGSAAKGINNGIVYLMVFPYVLVGIIGYFVYKSRKKVKLD